MPPRRNIGNKLMGLLARTQALSVKTKLGGLRPIRVKIGVTPAKTGMISQATSQSIVALTARRLSGAPVETQIEIATTTNAVEQRPPYATRISLGCTPPSTFRRITTGSPAASDAKNPATHAASLPRTISELLNLVARRKPRVLR